MTLSSRFRSALAALSGETEPAAEGQLMTDPVKTSASVAALQASAQRVVDAYNTVNSSLTDLQTQIANLDDAVSSQIDAITATLDAAVPANTLDLNQAPQ